MPPEDALYLVDGTYNVFRAFHARGVPDMRAPDGTPTKATYIFTRMLLSLLEGRGPRWLGVAFDREGPTIRHEQFRRFLEEHPGTPAEQLGYKGTRPEIPEDLIAQIPWCQRVCEGLRVPVLELEGFEADDVIGTLATQARAKGVPVVIVTADKDLFQLVGEGVTVLNPHKDNLMMNAAVVESEFGVPPERVVDVLALMGDASDNIPGVPGIGQKGARDLVMEMGSVEEVLARAAEVRRRSYRESLQANAARALFSKALATIRRDAPVSLDLDALEVSEPDRAALGELFGQLQFRSLREKYGRADETVAEPAGEKAPEEAASRTALETGDIEAFLRGAGAASEVALVALTGQGRTVGAPLAGLGLALRTGESLYVPLGHGTLGAPAQMAAKEAGRALGPLLRSGKIEKVGHDLKGARIALRGTGASIEGPVFDTMIAAYLLDPSRRGYGLAEIAGTWRVSPEGAGEVPAEGDRADATELEVSRAARLAGGEGALALRLAAAMRPQLAEQGLEALYRDVELPLIEVLADMELAGVRIDVAYLGEFSRELKREAERLAKEAVELAGRPFNPDSPVQLRKILFEDLGLKPVGRTAKAKAASTRDEDLEILAAEHPLPAKIRDYRAVAKLRSTYVDALPPLVLPETGRVHASFNQTGAASGRLSSSDPNLQNVPIRTDLGRRVRRAFLPEKGWRLVCADYSQMELRIMAHMAADATLVEAFERDEDIHRRTAAEIFGVAYDLVSEEQRRIAKTVNFGVIYGMSDFRLAGSLGIPRAEAKRFIEAYFGRYRAVDRYIKETIEQVERTGEVRTLLGRLRRFPEIRSGSFATRQQAQRAAVNTTVQGTAADLMKMAMIGVHRRLRKEALEARMLIQVHDELVLEAPPAELPALERLLRAEMEGVHPLSVRLAVEIRQGDNWLEAK